MPRRLQQLIGLIFILVGAAAALAAWLSPRFGDPLVREIAAVLSALAIFGLAMLVLPSPREERIGRNEDLWDMTGMQLVTARWWLVILLTLAVGGGHFAFVSNETGTLMQAAQASKK